MQVGKALIVEDHEDARSMMGLVVQEAFGTQVVRASPTLAAARREIADHKFDLIVLDLNLPDGTGDEFLLEILNVQPGAYVVISTIHDESDRLLRALENGAKGYLLKDQSRAALIREFQGIKDGRPPLAPAITRKLLDIVARREAHHTPPALHAESQGINEPSAPLTEREREVLSLLAKGFSRPEIGGLLNISKYTVATHIGKIYEKYDISSRGEAALIARANGLA